MLAARRALAASGPPGFNYVSSSFRSNSAVGPSLSVPVPAGARPGYLLVAFAHSAVESGDSFPNPILPGTWTVQTYSTDTTGGIWSIYTKAYAAGDPADIAIAGQPGDKLSAGVLCFSGSAINPYVTGSSNGSTVTTLNGPTLMTDGATGAHLYVCAFFDTGGQPITPKPVYANPGGATGLGAVSATYFFGIANTVYNAQATTPAAADYVSPGCLFHHA